MVWMQCSFASQFRTECIECHKRKMFFSFWDLSIFLISNILCDTLLGQCIVQTLNVLKLQSKDLGDNEVWCPSNESTLAWDEKLFVKDTLLKRSEQTDTLAFAHILKLKFDSCAYYLQSFWKVFNPLVTFLTRPWGLIRLCLTVLR